MTKVIYRTFKGTQCKGEVIALFPEIPADYIGTHCLSYMSVGQHGAASIHLSDKTRPSTMEEIKSMEKELKSLGYNDLEPRLKITQKMNQKRIDNLKS